MSTVLAMFALWLGIGLCFALALHLLSRPRPRACHHAWTSWASSISGWSSRQCRDCGEVQLR